jgi:predicted membrane-bound mannosyltransferase/DNA-binding beta-propeller fold protein YncE
MTESSLATATAAPRVSPFERLATFRVALSWELVFYVLLIAGGAALRYWDLGARALHHDESLHATYAWYLFDDGRYEHMPMMHGPFQFFGRAFFFLIFGVSDYSSRMLDATAGSVLIGLPFLLRNRLGRTGALAAAAFLALSPTMLYFSRFARGDIHMAVWTLGLVICMWRYIDGGHRYWLYGMAGLLALSFATKETTYLNAGVFLIFLNLWVAHSFTTRARRDANLDAIGTASLFILLVPFAWLLVAVRPFMSPRWRSVFGADELPRHADVLLILGTLSFPQLSAGIQTVFDHGFGWSDADFARQMFTINLGPISAHEQVTREEFVGFFTVIAALGGTALIGMRWNWRSWLICAAVFYVVYGLLYTTFMTNPDGFGSGIWGSLDYWIAQQGVRRGEQPFYYYLLLLPIYEFLPLIIALPAVAYQFIRGNPFGRFLAFWFVGALFGYSFAAEKMPWLNVHLTLVTIVLAAYTLKEVWVWAHGREWRLPRVEAASPEEERRKDYYDILQVSPTAGPEEIEEAYTRLASRYDPDVYTGTDAAYRMQDLNEAFDVLADPERRAPYDMAFGRSQPSATTEEGPVAPTPPEGRFSPAWPIAAAALGAGAMAFGVFGTGDTAMARILVGLAAVLAIAALTLTLRGRMMALMPVAAVLGALAIFSVRAAWMASYSSGDGADAREMLVYTQSTPDIPKVMRQIEEYAAQTGLGLDLPIEVDSTDAFTWPWAWYLRNYHQVAYPVINEDFEPRANAVILVNAGNDASIRSRLSGYAVGEPYHHRWWFPEIYKNMELENGRRKPTFLQLPLTTARDWVASLGNDDTWHTYWDYWRDRSLPEPKGSVDAVAYFPVGYKPSTPIPSGPVEAPEPDEGGRLTIGGYGAANGLFVKPAGMAVDQEGNLYVADSGNHRIQKFGSDGVFLAQVGGAGKGNGQFNEPWGVAVDAQGNVYVADTWNHRIQKFDKDLKYLTQWGSATSDLKNPKPTEFWGPREVTVDAQGNVWVADTGTSRVLKFDANGAFLAALGGPGAEPGKLNEPVGVVVAANGDIYVADAWNARVQRFDKDLKPLGAFPVPGWLANDPTTKPYLVLLPGGDIVASDPARQRVLRLQPDGRIAAAYEGSGEIMLAGPTGLAVSGDMLFIASTGTNIVRRIPLSDLAAR